SPLTGKVTNPGYFGNGQPTPPLPIPRTNYFGVPTGPLRDITDVETHMATAKIDYDVGNGVKVSNATRYIDNERFSRPTALRSLGTATAAFPNPPPANFPIGSMFTGRERRERETDNTYLVNQSDLVAKFATGALTHTLAAGLEFAQETRRQDRRDICYPLN